MSPKKQRIAIAEACGWSLVPNYSKVGLYGYHNRQPSYDVAECPPGAIPDYLTDLNAMHEAEKTLTQGQHETWAGHMANVCTRPTLTEALFVGYWSRGFKIMSSTAAQRAEAFLRTIGKWEEATP